VGEKEADDVLGFFGVGMAEDGEAAAAALEGDVAEDAGASFAFFFDVFDDGVLPVGDGDAAAGGAAGEEDEQGEER
jgi:hypothetical protein